VEIQDAKNRYLRTIAQICRAISSQLRHLSTTGRNLLNSNISPTCPYNMVNFGTLTAEICWRVWGTPANFHGFRVLAALLHGTPVVESTELCGVEQSAPPIFGRAAITLVIGPYSSWCWILYLILYFCAFYFVIRDLQLLFVLLFWNFCMYVWYMLLNIYLLTYLLTYWWFHEYKLCTTVYQYLQYSCTVHDDGRLRLDLRHCLSAASAVF